MRARALLLSLLAGCLPDLGTECAGDGDCAEGLVCHPSGVCVPAAEAGDGASGGSDARGTDEGPAPETDGPLPPPDGAIDQDGSVDAADSTSESPDAEVDSADARVEPRDAAPDSVDGPADAASLPDGAAADASPDACVPSPETCDGEDEDCDGEIDEAEPGVPLSQPCYPFDPATERVGPCRAGVATCVEGVFGECAGVVGPAPDVCNGVDDDCDGALDEDHDPECFSAAPGRQGVGPCRAGERACVNGGLGECVGQVLPTDEICDGVDNDCDGDVDDLEGGCDCAEGTTRACYTGPPETEDTGPCRAGSQRCVAGRFGPCEGQVVPAAEACNQVDDDCDGEVDEQPAVPCFEGVGACRGEGFMVCEGDRLVCDAVATLPGVERCNEIDDDCDGQTDEGLQVGDPCSVGVGSCEVEGVGACGPDGDFVCDAQPGAPAEEVCDGEDNDCDGQTDEVVESCYPFAGGQPGVGRCASGELRCGGACEGAVGPAQESCNGIDDDCDGQVDEGLGVGDECVVGEGICEAVGAIACVGGAAVCVGDQAEPLGEACNGVDDDCDGVVDDGEAICPVLGPSTVNACQQGQCVASCAPRWFDIDDDLADGCERGCPAADDGVVIGGVATQVATAEGDGEVATAVAGEGGVWIRLNDGATVRLGEGNSDGVDLMRLQHRWVVAARTGGQAKLHVIASDGGSQWRAHGDQAVGRPTIGRLGASAFICWVTLGGRLRGAFFAPGTPGQLLVTDWTYGGFAQLSDVRYVDDPLGAGVVGHSMPLQDADEPHTAAYALVRQQQIVQVRRSRGSMFPGAGRPTALRDGDTTYVAWATSGGLLATASVPTGGGVVERNFSETVFHQQGFHLEPDITLGPEGPLVWYGRVDELGGVRPWVLLLGPELTAVAELAVTSGPGYSPRATGGRLVWLTADHARSRDTGCR